VLQGMIDSLIEIVRRYGTEMNVENLRCWESLGNHTQ
jgi:hypothetical protein